MTSFLGFDRRCHLASSTSPLASSLDFLRGTFEKIHLHGFFGDQPFELMDLPTAVRRMRAGPRRIFAGFDCFEFSAPLINSNSSDCLAHRMIDLQFSPRIN
jgi:hypothetical protein